MCERYCDYILIFISLSLILAEDGKYKQVATSKLQQLESGFE